MEALKKALTSRELNERKKARNDLERIGYFDHSYFLNLFVAGSDRTVVSGMLLEVVRNIKRSVSPDLQAPLLNVDHIYKKFIENIESRITREEKVLSSNYYSDKFSTKREIKRSKDILEKTIKHPAQAELACQWAIFWDSLPNEERNKIRARKAKNNASDYRARVDWEKEPATQKQKELLSKLGYTEIIETKGKASQIIHQLLSTKKEGSPI